MENNSYLLETLKEFGNISGGNAAASLALLMDTQVYLSVSKVDKMTQLDLKTNDLRVEEHMISILLPFDGDMEGMLLFLLNQTFAQTYLKKVMQRDVCAYQLQEQELKMLEETASIMASAVYGRNCLVFKICYPHSAAKHYHGYEGLHLE